MKLTGVAETFLIPLWARAVETKRPGGIIKDEKAVEIMNSIDYDFRKFEKAGMSQIGVSVRTMILDNAVKAFILKHPDAVIVNIGAGLDTRFTRVDNGKIRWYDLDLPESIAVRQQFFCDTERCRMLPKSVFDYTWLKDIYITKEPVLVIAEGIFMYFEEAEIKELLGQIKRAFPASEILFESISVWASKNTKRHDSVNTTGAVFKWGADSGADIEAMDIGIKVLDERNFFDYIQKGQGNAFIRIMSRIPNVKKNFSGRIFHVK